MSRLKTIGVSGRLPEQIYVDLWPNVDIHILDEPDRELYLNRKHAVELYMKNEKTHKEIYEITGIERRNLSRLINRCIDFDENGVVWGFRALIPQKNLKNYELNSLSNKRNHNSIRKTGEFNQLLDKYPDIKDMIESDFLGKNRKLSEPVMKAKQIHKKFVDACRKKNISKAEYPFNTERYGYRALCRYLVKVRDRHFGKSSSRYGHDAEQKAKHSGIGQQNYPRTITPYQKVQFDGHRIDGIFAVKITTPDGDEVIRKLDRLWVLCLMDVATHTILGKPHICLNKEYSASDVMLCIQNAVKPYKRIPPTIDGLTYQETGGYPSNRVTGTEWAVWDIICFDNAKSHLANMVKDRLRNLIGCSTNLGPVDMPMRRSFIERFFHILEESSIHRMPNTTGSNPKDPRRKDPEEKAIQYEITYDHLEEIVDVVVSNYNGTPHGDLFYNSPLEAIEQRINRGMLPRLLSEEKRSDFLFLQSQLTRTVRGNIKTGKRPYVEFYGVEYRSDLLSRSAHLIGTELTLHVNEDDLRTIRAFLPDGSEVGFLAAAGKWSLTPHSLKMRKAMNQLSAKKVIHYTQWDDPIFVYYEYLSKQAKEKKNRPANKATQVQKAINKREEEVSDEQAQVIKEEKNTFAALEKAREIAAMDSMQEADEEQSMQKKFKTITF